MTSIRVWLTILCALMLSLAFALPATAQACASICTLLNTATGVNALSNNTTGDGNTATGGNALGFNTTGTANTATGADASATPRATATPPRALSPQQLHGQQQHRPGGRRPHQQAPRACGNIAIGRGRRVQCDDWN